MNSTALPCFTICPSASELLSRPQPYELSFNVSQGAAMPSNLLIVLALLLGVTGAVAQAPIETRGAWRLLENGQGYALRTRALDAPDSTLSLLCREQQQYAFEVKSPALAARPRDDETRVGIKIDDDDQVWLTLATGPDGTIPISHPTAFWIVHAALMRPEAKKVALTAGDHSWQFALDGLTSLTENLAERCGLALSAPPPPGR
jgi:hypothetical protein